MQKKKFYMMFLSTLMLIVSAVTFVFAWFTIVETSGEIIIITGQIEIDYQLEDVTNLSNKINITNQITYSATLPGDRFDYKLTLKNIGNINGRLNITFVFNAVNDDLTVNSDLLDAFTINYNYNESLEEFTSSDKFSLMTKEVVSDLDNVIIEPYDLNDYEYEFDFSVIFNKDYSDITLNQKIEITKIIISLEQSE